MSYPEASWARVALLTSLPLIAGFQLPISTPLEPGQIVVYPPPLLQRRISLLRSTKDDSDDENDIDLNAFSDEETLLACVAYLQRKNKLGAWTESKLRKQHARQASALGGSFSSESSVGYFWEDPKELVYWQNNVQLNDTEEILEEDDTAATTTTATVDVQENEANHLEGGFFDFPVVVPEESKRRSEATRKKWQDPEWKRMWYEKRWGSRRRNRQFHIDRELDRQKKLSDKVQALSDDILASPELAAMTRDEIAEAIRTQVKANRKRSETRTIKYRNKKLPQETVPPQETASEVLFYPSEQNLKAVRQERAERAAKAYQTRLMNAKQSATPSKLKIEKTCVPSAKTPRDALIRIEARLNQEKLPSIEDVDLIMQPLKLGRRKQLLRRILSEFYNLRGKCVPIDFHDADSPLEFVTSCTVDRLGAFVIHKMKQGQLEKQKDPAR